MSGILRLTTCVAFFHTHLDSKSCSKFWNSGQTLSLVRFSLGFYSYRVSSYIKHMHSKRLYYIDNLWSTFIQVEWSRGAIQPYDQKILEIS